MGKKKKDNELEAKCEEYLAGWKRALADYDNLKKDLIRERDDIRKSTTERLAAGFLAILDHFDQAIKHRPDFSECEEEIVKEMGGWITGVEHIRTAMTEEIKTFGLEQIEPSEGDMLDPNLHEAVESRSGDNPGTIVEVVSRGWKIGEKIIQPAKVIINE